MTESQITVLIVEDNQFMQSTVWRLVDDMEGIEVVAVAADGKEALQQAGDNKPQVVLMDIVLPQMDGIEAARIIKLRLPETKVLMVSGDEGDDAIVAAFAAGADGFCTKSTVLEQLEPAIRAVASGVTWLDPVIGERVLGGGQTTAALRFTIYAKMGLSALEVDVFQRMRKRVAHPDIASDLNLTVEEVDAHVKNIRAKLLGKIK